MTDDILKQSMEIIQGTAEKYLTEGSEPQLDVASKNIKEKMDHIYGPSWICIIGEAFAFNVKSQKENFVHCYIGEFSILLYKY